MEEIRQVLNERKRREVGDLCIGHLLSHAQPDANEEWPPQTIRALLEQLRSEEVEQEMETAAHNARGVTWRNMTDGGAPERHLMERYRTHAQTIQAR